ncbi:erythroid differentiation-related factor 1 [Lingula anatina]|uniref:Erythroid differentiation-related factor 1 n=1 Tax=Lingula anatina TaxID=7574 RepID=A0A1S3J371_LINAN|nr:erythroid differentiation-related factor 1 [Lingula anatina]|eukprot:XP_013404698.1 erythroid differentiation-related factor 1 [Lingula anatina]
MSETDNGYTAFKDTEVKSTAVVKYCRYETPATYMQLQKNTDLKEPPSNWLRGGSEEECYVKDMQGGKRSEFSSIKMAHRSPDLVDELDVISDSENIKKLLKLPYSKGHVSMMVHRVGKTLLLDDFDVHRHLLRQQEEDWEWMRKFYCETVEQNKAEKERVCLRKNNSRNFLQNRNMFSKFLYYSIQDNSGHSSEGGKESKQLLPESEQEPRNGEFQRTVIWNFEDIRMLIGTDLPIFGGEARPCVSLRLRDTSKPINVLTGIDYWLDNLMCNVPELAMCYHLDGIVQKYELFKTEEIPNLESSKFSPTVVKDIAQNILSFLKSNATKEGHTYWLFKETDNDVVKLYDLTTLCADDMNDKMDNPFTVPVGMLLYKVAYNMWQSSGRKKSGTIRTLLKNALKLLDRDKFSQVTASAYFILCDLFVNEEFLSSVQEQNLVSSDESDCEEEQQPHGWVEDEDDDEEKTVKAQTSVAVKTLRLPEKEKNDVNEVLRFPPVCGNVEDRCLEGLKFIAEGLKCIDSEVKEIKKRREMQEHGMAPKTCNPYQAIPLHYQPISELDLKPDFVHEDKENDDSFASSESRERSDSLVLLKKDKVKVTVSPGTWHYNSKVLLLRKGVLAYYSIADAKNSLFKYGQALKYVRLALLCFDAMRTLCPQKGQESDPLLEMMYSLTGDIRLMLTQNVNQLQVYEEAYRYMSEYDSVILESVSLELQEFSFEWACQFSSGTEKNLTDALHCYQLALEISQRYNNTEKQESLIKRQGNVRNELGVLYMNQAAVLTNEASFEGPSKQVEDLWKTSQTCFERGIMLFDSVSDEANIALLTSNIGRLMRLCAQAFVQYVDGGQRREFSAQERVYYSKACDFYKKALSIISSRSKNPTIWDSVSWELSSTYFAMASLLQDYAPLSTQAQEQIEKDVTNLMVKTLKYCDVETASPRQAACQYRAATIHHRLASLYHNAYRNQLAEQKKKHLRTLAELHYEKASHFFKLVDSWSEQLRVQLERVAMCEFQFNGQTSVPAKIKTLTVALDHILHCVEPLSGIERHITDQEEADDFQGYVDECQKLLSILSSRLHFVLLNIVKLQKSQNKKSKQQHVDVYKQLYAKSLQVEESVDSEGRPLLDRCQNTLKVLRDLVQLQHSIARDTDL